MVHLRQFFQHPAARATGIIFAVCGLIFGSWASFIPYVKDKFHLDEAQLGLLLLAMPVGTLIANPLTVLIISRWGAVRTSLLSLILMAIGFSLPLISPTVVLVALSLVFAGASFASTNVAMNTCASHLDEESGFKLMSTCHGMWSVGAMIGALVSGFGIVGIRALFARGFDPHLLYMGLIVVLTILIVRRVQRDMHQIHEDWARKEKLPLQGLGMLKPNKMLWILISISLCTFLTEGTIADWSAVYLRDMTDAPEAIVGWGFGLYAFFMSVGRFAGDVLIARHGSMTILRIGGQLVVLGLLIIIVSTSPWLALPGFMLTGLGVSVASPILYAEAARVPDMPHGAGLASMNSFGMAAFLGGPVLIGLIAEASNLRIAFMVVAGAAVIWIIQSIVIKRKKIIS